MPVKLERSIIPRSVLFVGPRMHDVPLFFLLQTFFFAGVLPRFVLFATTAPLSPPPKKK